MRNEKSVPHRKRGSRRARLGETWKVWYIGKGKGSDQGWKEHGKCGTEEGSEGILRKKRKFICLEHGRRDFGREGRWYICRERDLERRKDGEK